MWMALLLSFAQAQAQAQAPATATAAAPEPGELRWVVADVEAPRFPDRPEPKEALPAEAEVTVVFVEGDRVRIKAGNRYSWVAASNLTSEAPDLDFDVSDLLSRPQLSAPQLSAPRVIGSPGAGAPR